jgi:hypothetical protein
MRFPVKPGMTKRVAGNDEKEWPGMTKRVAGNDEKE